MREIHPIYDYDGEHPEFTIGCIIPSPIPDEFPLGGIVVAIRSYSEDGESTYVHDPFFMIVTDQPHYIKTDRSIRWREITKQEFIDQQRERTTNGGQERR